MLTRYIYTVHQFWRHRKLLRQYALDSQFQSPTVLSIEPQELYAQGIRAMIIDFDGVLAAHAAALSDPRIIQWLEACVKCFGREQVFVLSNKPTKNRQNYFAVNPTLPQFFVAKRQKPFPDGLLAIVQQCGHKPEEIVVIDDRLATGILAAIIGGVKAILITQPAIDFAVNPVREAFFYLLRSIERFFSKL